MEGDGLIFISVESRNLRVFEWDLMMGLKNQDHAKDFYIPQVNTLNVKGGDKPEILKREK